MEQNESKKEEEISLKNEAEDAQEKNNDLTKRIKLKLVRKKEEEWESVWNDVKEENLRQASPMDEGELRRMFDGLASAESKERGQKEDQEADEIETLKSIIFSEENVEYFIDQFREVYVKVKSDNRFEILRADSDKLKSWIIKKFNDLTDGIPKPSNVKKVLSLLRARAVYGENRYELSIRVAYSEDSIWYDIADESWKAIKIDKSGWSIVENPPILFKRNIQNEQVIPQQGGDVHDLLKFVNIKDEKQKLLFLISVIAYFVPNIPRPIQVYFGTQGSAKSTVSRISKSLVDPSKVELLTLLNETRELTQHLDQHYLLSFDNLAILKTKTSDTLCRAVTGGGLSKRKLYTDSDNVIFAFKRAIIINGVNLVANKPDLLDRSLLFELERIDETSRRAEEDFWKEFNEAKPKILGAVFDALSKSLAILPTIKLNNTPRMADFARWGCAIAEAIGHTQQEFTDAYDENCGLQNRQAIEENPIASAIEMLMKNRKNWNGTAQTLLKELRTIAEKEEMEVKLFPKSPSALSRKINEVKANLLVERVKIEKVGQREWSIDKA